MLKRIAPAMVVVAAVSGHDFAAGQVLKMIPPGQLVLGGVRVVCFGYPTRILPFNDIAAFDGQFINLNPQFFQLPPVAQLFTYGHECGHAAQGASETGADAWAIRVGKAQGWFPPQAFATLEAMFANNPGDFVHPPGPQRVKLMKEAYYGKTSVSPDSSAEAPSGATQTAVEKNAPAKYKHVYEVDDWKGDKRPLQGSPAEETVLAIIRKMRSGFSVEEAEAGYDKFKVTGSASEVRVTLKKANSDKRMPGTYVREGATAFTFSLSPQLQLATSWFRLQNYGSYERWATKLRARMQVFNTVKEDCSDWTDVDALLVIEITGGKATSVELFTDSPPIWVSSVRCQARPSPAAMDLIAISWPPP